MKELEMITQGPVRGQLEQETLRVYDVCDGCRRCFNLCPSFHTLLERIDDYESDLSRITAADHEHVEKECYYCKLCYNHCPYTPPHQYGIDFPHLMAVWKKLRAKEKRTSWRDRLLIKTDLIGRLGSLTAPLTNWTLRTPWIRNILESVLGIHRDRQVMPFQQETFLQWWKRRRPKPALSGTTHKVALFSSCMVNYQATDIGKATVQVLEKNNIEVVIPEHQQCCGMPLFDIGDTDIMIERAKHHAQLFRPFLESGYDLVIPTPSCSLMFKREYSYLCSDPLVNEMAQRSYDVSEYLMMRKREGSLCLEFPRNPGHVAYQIPCHLRDQNIGFKSKDLMELTGAQVTLIEQCSGHDGTWGTKTEFFDLSMNIAKKAMREVGQCKADIIASDCPLSAIQLDQASGNTIAPSAPTLHPIQIVRHAYQLPT